MSQAEWIKGPETIHLFIVRKVNKVIEQFVRVKLGDKVLSDKKKYLLINIYINWDYFHKNIRELCCKLYGRACCADKSRWLLNKIKQWCIKDSLPNMSETTEDGNLCYWIPESGSFEQWLNYIIGLNELSYGNPELYLSTYQSLLLTHAT